METGESLEDETKSSMKQILDSLKVLTPDDIRDELMRRGERIGPLMPSMRHLFEKKLARMIAKDRGVEFGDDDVSAASVEKPPEMTSCTASMAGCSTESTESAVYYAISLPEDYNEPMESLVFNDKKLAMSLMRTIRGSRFKIFKDQESAQAFTRLTAEEIFSSPKPATTHSRIQEEKKSDSKQDEDNNAQSQKRSYKEPTRADRIRLKSAVENGEVDTVSSLIWENPHYLISVGETPVILQEAFRYNALHLAAKCNQADVCRLLLDAIRSSEYHELLFPDDADAIRKDRIQHLTDLYLNMPDKGGGESALHFACKYGSADVVDVLLLYPQCDRFLLNKMAAKPHDVINKRANNPNPDTAQRIKKSLMGVAYVPLYRGFGTLPVIGQPTGMESTHNDERVKAFAGPMSWDQAEKFHKCWSLYPPNSPQHVQKQIKQTKRSDYDKGLERLGRDLCEEHDVTWHEYWDFLSSFTNLRDTQGLLLLEQYLARKTQSDHNGNVLTNSNSSNTKHSYHGNETSSSDEQTIQVSITASAQLTNASKTDNLCSQTSIDDSNVSGDAGLPSNRFFSKDTLPSNQFSNNNDSSLDNQTVESGSVLESDLLTNALLTDRFCGEARSNASTPSNASSLSNQSFNNASSPSNPSTSDALSPSELSILALEFEKLRLQDSSRCSSELNPRCTLNYDIDSSGSESEGEFISAPTSPAKRNSGAEVSPSPTNLDSDSDDFLDASEDPIQTSLLTCLRTPVQRFMMPRTSRRDDNVYLDGNIPTKLDLDVLRAVGMVSVKADMFPYFTKWRKAVTSFSNSERNSWPSPSRARRLLHQDQYPRSPLISPGQSPRVSTDASTPGRYDRSTVRGGFAKMDLLRSQLDFDD